MKNRIFCVSVSVSTLCQPSQKVLLYHTFSHCNSLTLHCYLYFSTPHTSLPLTLHVIPPLITSFPLPGPRCHHHHLNTSCPASAPSPPSQTLIHDILPSIQLLSLSHSLTLCLSSLSCHNSLCVPIPPSLSHLSNALRSDPLCFQSWDFGLVVGALRVPPGCKQGCGQQWSTWWVWAVVR